jgi:hypothetical protein
VIASASVLHVPVGGIMVQPLALALNTARAQATVMIAVRIRAARPRTQDCRSPSR